MENIEGGERVEGYHDEIELESRRKLNNSLQNL